MDNTVLTKMADNIRILSASMVEKAKSGHPGGAMGGADFMAVLFSEFLVYSPKDRNWVLRDRFFLDPGHMSPMLYSTLALSGSYSLEELKQFRQWESTTPGHPELDTSRGVENTSGPLGVGHVMGVGAAIAERFLCTRFGEWMSHKTYAYISDGGIQEEISQGAGRLAGHLGLSNFIMFYDSNDIQLSHETDVVTSEDTARKYESWGWRVETIDGNDIEQIRSALKAAHEESEKPTLIIGKTVMGKGAVTASGDSYEGQCSTHGMPLSKAGASFENTIQALGGDPENPFQIFPEVASALSEITEEKTKVAAEKQGLYDQWTKDNPEEAEKLASFLSEKVPAVNHEDIEQKSGIATRSASGAVLAEYAKQIDNMIVCSADLSNSDNTNGYLKNTTEIKKGDFSGKFLQIGVSELTMAGIANGMALHGGIIPVCGTFFVFSDYMKPAVRLAALMELPVKYVWTHDAFRVGEDGPTHQPVEHEAQIRLMEKMNNLQGKRSMLVLRPGDAVETTVAWKLALENTTAPTALILSRQNIADIPAPSGNRYKEALGAEKGVYTVKEVDGKADLILAANGSEVSLCIETAEKLEKENNISVKVVSAISEGIFREQPTDYQETTLPFGAPILGITAGLPVSLTSLTGPLGKVVGLTRFGASAPFTVLDEKFGYTVDSFSKVAVAYLKEYQTTLEKISSLSK